MGWGVDQAACRRAYTQRGALTSIAVFMKAPLATALTEKQKNLPDENAFLVHPKSTYQGSQQRSQTGPGSTSRSALIAFSLSYSTRVGVHQPW